MERTFDLLCQTVFNILFFLYRIEPFRYDHPFAGRVILAFGEQRKRGTFFDKKIIRTINVSVGVFQAYFIILVAFGVGSTTWRDPLVRGFTSRPKCSRLIYRCGS
jgi:hypothetical protein